MPSSHLILCHPLLLLPPIPPSIRVFSNESALRMRWPKYWSFSFSISLSNEPLDFLPLLQVIFPMQGLNPGLLHCRQIFIVRATREAHTDTFFIFGANSTSRASLLKVNRDLTIVIYHTSLIFRTIYWQSNNFNFNKRINDL